jgi:hypothetical protein
MRENIFMTKTHAEFLEELKEYINKSYSVDSRVRYNDIAHGSAAAYLDVLNKIEQFEAEQKQVKDEQKYT